MDESPAHERREVCYHGRVQGVGFRLTVCRIARRHAVTGWVRNLPDGAVLLTAESEATVLDRFLREVAAEMDGYIVDAEVAVARASGEFAGFVVRT